MRFTDRGIAALKPRADRYEAWEDGRSGFGVRVAPSGRKSWIFMYRFGGKARRMTLGSYPAVPLASARVKFAEAKHKLDRGEDPGALAKSEKLADRSASTVRQLIDEYLERSAKDRKGYREIKRILEHDVAPAWGNRKAKAIKRRDVILLLDGIVDRGSPIMANRTLSWVRRMFNFAARRDIVDANPCFGIEAPSREIERERVLSDEELQALWNGLPNADTTDATRLAVKLLLVTAQRPGEVAGAMIAEFNIDQRLWSLPAERTKNGRPHLVPLSTLALSIVEAARGERRGGPLFPNRTGKPLTSQAIGRAFYGNVEALGIPVPARRQPVPDDPRASLAARRERRHVAFSPHDLRRTASTRMTELGFTRFIVDRVLNHVEPGVGRVYDRYEYLREKRQALETWTVRLEEILDRPEGRRGQGCTPAASLTPSPRLA
jgi:integrase